MFCRKLLQTFAILFLGTAVSGCSTVASKMMARMFEPASVIQSEEQAAQTYTGQIMGLLSEPSEDPNEWRIATQVFNRLKKTLEKRKEGSSYNYRIIVLRSKMINAFSLPNGRVYLFSGMLDVIQDEHELAVVLGHEIAHAELNHYRARKVQAAKLDVTLGLRGLKFGRRQEIESDRFGAKLAQDAGFEPGRYFNLHERLGRLFGERQGLAVEFLMSHPFSSTRRMALEIAGFKVKKGSSSRVHPSLKSIRAGRLKQKEKYGESRWSDVFDEPKLLNPQVKLGIQLVKWGLQLDHAMEILQRVWRKSKKPAILPWLVIAAARSEGGPEARRLMFKAKEVNPWSEVAYFHSLNETQKAFRVWAEISKRESCRVSLDCLRRAVLAGDRIFPYGQGKVGQVARRFEIRLREKTAGKLPVKDQLALNVALARQAQDAVVAEDRSFDLAVIELRTWKDRLNSTPYVKDMERVVQLSRDHDLQLDDYYEWGLSGQIRYGGMGLEGGLAPLAAFGTAVGTDIGIRFWPFELFFTMDLQNGSNSASNELNRFGGGVGFGFKTGLLAHWLKWSLSHAVAYDRPRVDAQTALTDGFATGVAYAWSLPLLGTSFGTLSLRPEGEISYIDIGRTPSSAGRGWGWRVGVGFELLWGSRGRTPGVESLMKSPRNLF